MRKKSQPTKTRKTKEAKAKKAAPKNKTYSVDLSQCTSMQGLYCVCIGHRKPSSAQVRKAFQKFQASLTPEEQTP